MVEFLKRNIKIFIIITTIIIISILGITLAYTMDDIGITIASGEYNVVYSGTATLPSTNLTPIYDSELLDTENASKVMKIDFTVKGAESNPTDIPIIYDVSLTNLDMPLELQSEYLKWRLYKNGTQLSEGDFSRGIVGKRKILTSTQQDLPDYSSEVDSYTFYIWISEACIGDITSCTEDMDLSALVNRTFSGEIRIELSTKGKITNTLSYSTLSNLKLTPTTYVTPDFSDVAPDILVYKEIEGSSGSSEINETTNAYYVTYADSYSFDEETGKYSLVEPSVAEYKDVYVDLVGKYIVSTSLSTTSSMAKYTNLSTIYYVVSATYDGDASIGVIEYNSSTSDVEEYDYSDTGIFSAEDDLGMSYFFRGNIDNNYVYFAGFYWRIIRINGDGTVRMIYDGISAHANGEKNNDRYLTKNSFNSEITDNAYVGYMFGTPGSTTYEKTHANINDSEMKKYLDNWYKTNIVDEGYSNYVADAIYCNDRSLDTTNSSYTGIGTISTYYAANQRIIKKTLPSLKCSQENDKFTVNSELGNGMLTYPIGLITADEVMVAGGGTWENIPNNSYYLYIGNDFLTMTPFTGSGTTATVYFFMLMVLFHMVMLHGPDLLDLLFH